MKAVHLVSSWAVRWAEQRATKKAAWKVKQLAASSELHLVGPLASMRVEWMVVTTAAT